MFPVLLAVFWVTSQPSVGRAPAMTRGYVQVTPILSVVPAGEASYHRVRPNLGGAAAGLSIGGGARIAGRVSVEGEFVYGGAVTADQTFTYFWSIAYRAESRDRLLNGLARIEVAGLEVVGGGGAAFSRATKARQIESRYDPIQRRVVLTPIPDTVETVSGVTWTAGVDKPLRVHRHWALVPSFRFRWIARPEPAMTGWLGSGSFGYQFGLGIRPAW